MESQPQAYRFTWAGIEIEAIYTPLKWGVIAHLEIRSIKPARARLPITSTGYRSHFHQPGTIEAHGGDVEAQVIAWLDDEARKPEWQRHSDAARQGTFLDQRRRKADCPTPAAGVDIMPV